MSIPSEYLKAGRIASEVREEVRRRYLVGKSFLEVCDEIESSIRSKGGEPAFPCNICVNDIAAHYTAVSGDKSYIRDGDVVKIDIGVHINGYIADTAITLCHNPEYYDLVQAAEAALKEAVRCVKANMMTGEIGKAVAEAAERRGFRPITNLSGHMIEPYKIHAGVSIPNIWVPNTPILKANEVYAIEPFLTTLDGAGTVVEGSVRVIYSVMARRKTGDKKLDSFVQSLWEHYRTLPFAARWLDSEIDPSEVQFILNSLLRERLLRAYPVLIEARGKCVAQFEHTVIPKEEGAIVITL